MSERRVTLALGGGAAKGLAHVGVLCGLEEDGIEVAAIAGTSMGSIIGALYAGGMAAEEMRAFFTAVDWSRLARIMIRSMDGSAFHDLLRQTVGPRSIEDLRTPFAAVCCDLETAGEVVLGAGGLADAVRASSAIPGILAPLEVDGRRLVDGAMVTPVPVEAARSLDDATVLAVNVLRPPAPGATVSRSVEPLLLGGTAPAALLQHVEEFLRRHRFRLGGRDRNLPNRLEVVARSFHIMQYNLSRSCSRQAPTIEPAVGGFGWFEFQRAAEIIEEGYQAYRSANRDLKTEN